MKEFWKSMTFWGALLLGVMTAFDSLSISYPTLAPIAKGLGTVLTIFGIRRALK